MAIGQSFAATAYLSYAAIVILKSNDGVPTLYSAVDILLLMRTCCIFGGHFGNSCFKLAIERESNQTRSHYDAAHAEEGGARRKEGTGVI
jgi:hypothetical protein